MPSDIEIAQAAKLQRINKVALERLGIAESRRVRGLGTKQVAALEREFGQS